MAIPRPRKSATEPPGSPLPRIKAFAWAGGALFVLSLLYFLHSYLRRFGGPTGGGAGAVTADILLFTAFALHHSVFARSGAKAWVRRIVPAALERSVYTWIASALFIAVCWFWQPVHGVFYRLEQPWRSAAYLVQGAGIVLTFLGSRALDVLDLAGIRQVLRQPDNGLPAHVPLSTTGVFGVVRHPLYFGWALLVCAAPDMTATRAVFALVSCLYLAVAIVWEERGLEEIFGAAYVQYRRRVRWRMIPFVY
jgi:methanethiol S-methyltransferase